MAVIDPGSRYAGLPTIEVTLPDGTTQRLGAPRIAHEPRTRGVYEVQQGDRIDLISFTATGDSTRWWVLADANPWADATRLEEPGTVVGLPDV
jgi:hypothetical protein